MIDQTTKAALHFSGGKDSLACLYLLRQYWDQITVMWCNTGAAFPETLAQMEVVRSMVPNFIEVKSDQPAQVKEAGSPSDLISWWDTPIGRALDNSRTARVQTPTSCCRENIWTPMAEATKKLGATLIIRGQRNSEQRKATIRSGHVEDGVRYWFPLEDWPEADVLAYLKEIGVPLPENYEFMDTSLDCWSCTAYLDENMGKRAYMKARHPDLYEHTKSTLSALAASAKKDVDRMIECAQA